MPRDIGSGLYHYPDGTPGIPGQTVFSARYNTFIDDLSNTLNTKLPVNMGGTGADNASAARDNIDAEVSGAQVFNYDTHVFENGSFWSNAGATGSADITKPFWGYAYGIDANNINITARNGQFLYNRVKFQGAWGLWSDSMSLAGDVIIDKANPSFWLNKKASGQQSVIYSMTANKVRWVIVLGDTAAETGANAGSDFNLLRYDDAGNYLGSTMTVNRKTGLITFSGTLAQTNGDFWVQRAVPEQTMGNIRFGTDVNKYLWFDGTDFHFGGGHLVLDNAKGINCNSAQITTFVNCATVSATSTIYAAGTITGGSTIAASGAISTSSQVYAKYTMFIDAVTSADNPALYLRNEALTMAGMFFWNHAADEVTMSHWTGTSWRLGSSGGTGWVASSADSTYKPSGGAWIAGSDARIKTVHGDYQHGLDEVLALRPVIYSYKGNDVFGKTLPPDAKDAKDASLHGAVIGKQFVGLVAQECEGVMPEMVAQVSGFIDSQPVTDMRTLDVGPLLFALVNAVKELTARIATLEAAQATP